MSHSTQLVLIDQRARESRHSSASSSHSRKMFKHVFPDARPARVYFEECRGVKRMDGGVMQERSEAAGQEAQAAGHAASVCAKGLKPETAAGPPWKDAFSAEEVEGERREGKGSFVTSQDGSDFLAYTRSDRTRARVPAMLGLSMTRIVFLGKQICKICIANRGFSEWKLVDMMEDEVKTMMRALAL